MKVLVGLGNPGEKYHNNRHNVGFLFIEYLAKKATVEFKADKYLHGEVAKLDSNLSLLKPDTFMNLSGKSVAAYVARYTLNVMQDIIVIHDDLDIPLGKFKIQKGNGPQLHNGLDSVDEHLHTKEYWRIRIGVDNRDPARRVSGEEYTLQNFTPDELKSLGEIFSKITSHPVYTETVLKP